MESYFTRKASGLVREAGLSSSLALNIGFAGGPYALWYAYMVSSALYGFPAGDFGGAALLTGLIGLPCVALMYAFLAISMPRSGGDYIFISRAIRPEIGFPLNFTAAMMWAYYVAWGCYWAVGPGVANLVGIVGYLSNNAGLLAASIWLLEPNSLFLVATIFIIFFGLLVGAGIKIFLRYNLAIFIIGLIGMAIFFVIMGTTSPEIFAEKFNTFMLTFVNDPNYHGTIIQEATALGWNPNPGFSLKETFMIIPIVASSFAAIEGTAYIAGEVKRVERTQILSMGVGMLFIGLMNAIVYWASIKGIGWGFSSAVNYLWYEGTLAFDFWPVVNLWTMISAGEPFIAFVTGLGFLFLGIMYIPINILLVSRMTFAWSFDRIFPTKISQVDKRFHSPLWCIAFWIIMSFIFLIIEVYTTLFAALAAFAGIALMNLLSAVSAMILPKRRPDIYAASAVSRYKVFGIPLISIFGLGGVILLGFIVYSIYTNPAYGANSPSSLAIIATLIIIGIIIYFVSKAIHKARGIDVSLAFKEIPPE